MNSQFENADIQPIRPSILLLLLKIIILNIALELPVLLAGAVLIDSNLPLEWHHHSAIGGLVLIGIKNVLLIITIVILILNWLGHETYLSRRHLIRREGIWNVKNHTYELKNIRSVLVHQTLIGKILRYGDVRITLSDPHYTEEIRLRSIPNPNYYGMYLKECF